ncbi:hypothetical protein ACFSTE_21880 [Aquimarina hainanensis]|uniref:DUF4296 domain-containing protein n=1 Tax=Aquimarina hainanensis TaxID=1578017 RepID=A0ABW5NDT3_9FLAO|nr:hypothetical protein [Aquimarina sp. TRL1]QKX07356.1 hypothetical protein HN014_21380 [Aquimarina sp. TRL1]
MNRNNKGLFTGLLCSIFIVVSCEKEAPSVENSQEESIAIGLQSNNYALFLKDNTIKTPAITPKIVQILEKYELSEEHIVSIYSGEFKGALLHQIPNNKKNKIARDPEVKYMVLESTLDFDRETTEIYSNRN